jgi:hypothetical protein
MPVSVPVPVPETDPEPELEPEPGVELVPDIDIPLVESPMDFLVIVVVVIPVASDVVVVVTDDCLSRAIPASICSCFFLASIWSLSSALAMVPAALAKNTNAPSIVEKWLDDLSSPDRDGGGLWPWTGTT